MALLQRSLGERGFAQHDWYIREQSEQNTNRLFSHGDFTLWKHQ